MSDTKMKAKTVVMHFALSHHLEYASALDNEQVSRIIEDGYEILKMDVSYRPDERLVDGYEPMLTLLMCKKETICAGFGSDKWDEAQQHWVCNVCGKYHRG
jgi:hypothetical protein